MRKSRRNSITLILLSSVFFLSGCARLPFLSKRQESEEMPREALVVEALEKNQMELSSKQDQLKAELETLRGAMEEYTADATTSKSRIEALMKKTDRLEADLTEMRNGLAAVGKLVEAKLAEAQKKNETNLTQLRGDIQQLLTKHDQMDASLKGVKEALEKRQPRKKRPN